MLCDRLIEKEHDVVDLLLKYMLVFCNNVWKKIQLILHCCKGWSKILLLYPLLFFWQSCWILLHFCVFFDAFDNYLFYHWSSSTNNLQINSKWRAISWGLSSYFIVTSNKHSFTPGLTENENNILWYIALI